MCDVATILLAAKLWVADASPLTVANTMCDCACVDGTAYHSCMTEKTRERRERVARVKAAIAACEKEKE